MNKILSVFALIILALALSLPLGSAAPIQAQVVSVTGEAEFALPLSSSYSPLKAGQLLPTGSSVRTGDDGKVVLRTTPGTALEVDTDSILKLTDLAFQTSNGNVTECKVHVQLDSGAVSGLANPTTSKINDFRIHTPNGALLARGTFYAVHIVHGKTYVKVKEGRVVAVSSIP